MNLCVVLLKKNEHVPPAVDKMQHLKLLAKSYDSEKVVELMKKHGMDEFAEVVEENDIPGPDILTTEMVHFEDVGITSAVMVLRFKVLFERELTQKQSEVALKFPVEKVVKLCREERNLNKPKIIRAIQDNQVDGEMLLRAGSAELRELGIPALAKRNLDKILTQH